VLTSFADNRNPNSLAAKMRKRRFALFLKMLAALERPIKILDVGGTQDFWEVMGFGPQDGVSVALLNVYSQPTSSANFTSTCGDARAMVFADQSFDVVFSNSVIEHVGGIVDQRQMASEVTRVGVRYFIQTPNKYFPIEPHFLFPFFQFLPIGVRTWLLQHFDLGWHKKTADYASAREQVAGVQLLSKRQFCALFPNAAVVEERFAGLTKSFVAHDGWDKSV
jgi:Methyltransferase domain